MSLKEPVNGATRSQQIIHSDQEQQEELYRNLSSRFFGNRILDEEKWGKLQKKWNDIEWAKRNLIGIFKDFTEDIESFNPQLVESWKDFLYILLEFVIKENYNFQKASTLIEVFVHIFEESFKNRISQEKSFELFKDILVRHCLFRPPVSISVFCLSDLHKITDFALATFYRNYQLYFFAFTPKVNVEIRTHQMFKSLFPLSDSLAEAQQINRADIELLDEYLIDRETGLTPEQLEEIMRGDSIHRVPAKKRQEWLRLKEERERKEKIDKALQKELEKLQQEMEGKIQQQDEEFLQQVELIKNPPKKK